MKDTDFKKLAEEIPFKWRVQSQYPKKPAKAEKFTCIAYIDSRQVQDILDDVCGPANWQTEYYELKGNIYCKLGILINDSWIWKTDVGTPGDIEKEKSEASDALKRAAVHWGIGRFLYNTSIIKLEASNNKPFYNGKELWTPAQITQACNDYLKSGSKPKKAIPAKKELPEDVKEAIAKLKNVTSKDELGLFGKSLPEIIRKDKAFVNAATALNQSFL